MSAVCVKGGGEFSITGLLTDLQLSLNASLAALPVVWLGGVVFWHHLHKLAGKRGVLETHRWTTAVDTDFKKTKMINKQDMSRCKHSMTLTIVHTPEECSYWRNNKGLKIDFLLGHNWPTMLCTEEPEEVPIKHFILLKLNWTIPVSCVFSGQLLTCSGFLLAQWFAGYL